MALDTAEPAYTYEPDALAAADIDAYLEAHQHKSLLRFITCGSVDDGKSTLIGRLLYDTHAIFEDQLTALDADSRRFGTQGGGLDFALLVDGLSAEREQGITIDVAYRFFSTERRKFIVADTPGHEQYTRNMVTGASTADLAVILVDARKGVLTQTRRHSFLVSLLGVRKVVLAVNKLDLVGYDPAVFAAIEADYRAFAARIGLTDILAIPISGLGGDNIASAPSSNTPWYTGPSLLEHLETVEVEDAPRAAPFRLPVQWVNRPDPSFRGFAGLIASGAVAPGDRVRILPSGREAEVARIVSFDGDLDQAVAGQSVTLTLTEEVDVSRGDVIAAASSPPEVGDQFDATLVWMADAKLALRRDYWLKVGARTVAAQVVALRSKIDVNTLEHGAADALALNEIGEAVLHLASPIPFDPYLQNRDTGGLILVDRLTNVTVGAGLLRLALRTAGNIHWQALDVGKAQRAAAKGQKPVAVWFTGLSGAGKSTIANLVEKRLAAQGRHTYLLDGDNVRHGLNRDLGFSDAARAENIRRVAEVAKLMTDAGLITLVSFISPFRAERDAARALFDEGEFIEVFVDAALDVAERRDPKGLYSKARAGELQGFTGIDSPYEPPLAPDLRLDTSALSAEAAAEAVVAELQARGLLTAHPVAADDYEI